MNNLKKIHPCTSEKKGRRSEGKRGQGAGDEGGGGGVTKGEGVG